MLHPGAPGRPRDESLSVYWLEFLGGSDNDQNLVALRTYLLPRPHGDIKLTRQQRLAVLHLGEIRVALTPSHEMRAEHLPRNNDPLDPHSGLFGLDRQDEGLEAATLLTGIANRSLAVAKE